MYFTENLVRNSMDKEEIIKRIMQEEDYVRCPKFSNSLTKFIARNSEGVDDVVIARLLMMPEEEVKKIYEEAIAKLREDMVESEE